MRGPQSHHSARTGATERYLVIASGLSHACFDRPTDELRSALIGPYRRLWPGPSGHDTGYHLTRATVDGSKARP
jgi:hypothetical protein